MCENNRNRIVIIEWFNEIMGTLYCNKKEQEIRLSTLAQQKCRDQLHLLQDTPVCLDLHVNTW